MISLLYVSRATFSGSSEDRHLLTILDDARSRNSALGVTGALLYLNGRFAQILEGEAAEVNQLMIDILRDDRHEFVRIIEVAPITGRRFASWGMAWVPPAPGPLSYIDILVRHGSDLETTAAAAALSDYMAQFAAGDVAPA